MTDLIGLAERCEQATGPDRELDAAVAISALGFFIAEPRYEGAPIAYGYIDEDGRRVEPGQGGMQLIRNFTASLDAAMLLVPGQLWGVELAENAQGEWRCKLATSETRAAVVSEGASTKELALCAGALRSQASRQEAV